LTGARKDKCAKRKIKNQKTISSWLLAIGHWLQANSRTPSPDGLNFEKIQIFELASPSSNGISPAGGLGGPIEQLFNGHHEHGS